MPRKALLRLGDRTVLEQVIARTRQVASTPVILATSDRDVDDDLAACAARRGVMVYRGEYEDVAARGLGCASHVNAEAFVRICGDSPFFDPRVVQTLTAIREEEDADLATTNFPRSFPRGASVEVIASRAVARLLAATSDHEDREHVCRYFYANPGQFTICNLTNPLGDQSRDSLAIDTPEDLERSRFIVDTLGEQWVTATLSTIREVAKAWASQKPHQPHLQDR